MIRLYFDVSPTIYPNQSHNIYSKIRNRWCEMITLKSVTFVYYICRKIVTLPTDHWIGISRYIQESTVHPKDATAK